MTIITPDELKIQLKLQGVSETLIGDNEELKKIIDLKIDEIISITGIPIKPVTRKQIIKLFKGDLFETEHYPVTSITSFKIDGNILTWDDYVLDENSGIIYLNRNRVGLLVIEYTQQVSQQYITSKINPLLIDMVYYYYTSNNADMGTVSSIKEVDTQINYNTDNSLGNRIYNRIESLKTSYNSSKVRWL